MWWGFIKLLFVYGEAFKIHSEAVLLLQGEHGLLGGQDRTLLQDKCFDHDRDALRGCVQETTVFDWGHTVLTKNNIKSSNLLREGDKHPRSPNLWFECTVCEALNDAKGEDFDEGTIKDRVLCTWHLLSDVYPAKAWLFSENYSNTIHFALHMHSILCRFTSCQMSILMKV